MEIQLKIIGFSLIVLALVHVVFPKYFDWTNELKPLSLVNREMMYVHTFFIALAVFLSGLLCFTSSIELVQTLLGKRVCLGLGIFWGIRLVIQFVGYSAQLWRGKRFETMIHIVFTCFWAYLTFIFFSIYFQ